MAKPVRILVIDDDPALRDYLLAFGETRGMTVHAFADAEAAIAALAELRPDLITLDLVLPGMEGQAALRELCRRAPEVPVLMLSGHGKARSIVEAMQEGAVDFLRKPFEPEELEMAIARALEASALAREVGDLRGRVEIDSQLEMICGDDPQMCELRATVDQVADTDITVLIRGESGTGKELVAQALHRSSRRRSKPFVKLNCAALPSELLESELFGFEKGAFTGAQRKKLGKFEFADHGTIFLDEISEMLPPLQAKLLQVLQDGEFSPLGGRGDVRVDTRVLAATNRNLEVAVEEGRFRQDLFYRLNVVTITIPPLRERVGAVPLLAEHFRLRYNTEYARSLGEFSPAVTMLLERYTWPGNVRELENLVKRAVVLGSEDAIRDELSQRVQDGNAGAEAGSALDLRGVQAEITKGHAVDLKAVAKRVAQVAERRVIERVLDRTRWNRKEAAKRLQVSYKALLYKMKESGLSEAKG
jgi:two-component system response regulator AtoC